MSACSCSQIWRVGVYSIHMCNRTESPLPQYENTTNTFNVSKPVTSPSTFMYTSPSPYLDAMPGPVVATGPSSAKSTPSFVVSSPSSSANTTPSSFVVASPSPFAITTPSHTVVAAGPSPGLRASSRTPAANTNTPSTWIDANIDEDTGVIVEPSSGVLLNHQTVPPATAEEAFNPLYLLLLTPFLCLAALLSWWRYKRKKRGRAVSPRDVKLKDKASVAKPVPKTVKMENPVIEALKLQGEVNRAVRLKRMLQNRGHRPLPPLPPPEKDYEEEKNSLPPPQPHPSLFLLTNSEEEV